MAVGDSSGKAATGQGKKRGTTGGGPGRRRGASSGGGAGATDIAGAMEQGPRQAGGGAAGDAGGGGPGVQQEIGGGGGSWQNDDDGMDIGGISTSTPAAGTGGSGLWRWWWRWAGRERHGQAEWPGKPRGLDSEDEMTEAAVLAKAAEVARCASTWHGAIRDLPPRTLCWGLRRRAFARPSGTTPMLSVRGVPGWILISL